jgi:hypothetical protein
MLKIFNGRGAGAGAGIGSRKKNGAGRRGAGSRKISRKKYGGILWFCGYVNGG